MNRRLNFLLSSLCLQLVISSNCIANTYTFDSIFKKFEEVNSVKHNLDLKKKIVDLRAKEVFTRQYPQINFNADAGLGRSRMSLTLRQNIYDRHIGTSIDLIKAKGGKDRIEYENSTFFDEYAIALRLFDHVMTSNRIDHMNSIVFPFLEKVNRYFSRAFYNTAVSRMEPVLVKLAISNAKSELMRFKLQNKNIERNLNSILKDDFFKGNDVKIKIKPSKHSFNYLNQNNLIYDDSSIVKEIILIEENILKFERANDLSEKRLNLGFVGRIKYDTKDDVDYVAGLYLNWPIYNGGINKFKKEKHAMIGKLTNVGLENKLNNLRNLFDEFKALRENIIHNSMLLADTVPMVKNNWDQINREFGAGTLLNSQPILNAFNQYNTLLVLHKTNKLLVKKYLFMYEMLSNKKIIKIAGSL